ncbi:hypothetical protein BJ742DRAFT_845707 [Cladochytrium replicatum]|nr:hypothetical protein BJ742DRAFT_845707 [Cladochytrium replicatum]
MVAASSLRVPVSSYARLGLGINQNLFAAHRSAALAAVLPRATQTLAFRTVAPARSKAPASDSRPTLDQDAFEKGRMFNRPVSPHLTIYQPQLTWLVSIFHRFTGGGIAALLYGTGIAYALAPFDTAVIASTVQSLPAAVVLLGKTAFTAPLVFHSVNGIRHLIWDTGRALTIKGVYSSGYFVLASTAVITAALLLI